MALCVVANGWSDNGGVLTENLPGRTRFYSPIKWKEHREQNHLRGDESKYKRTEITEASSNGSINESQNSHISEVSPKEDDFLDGSPNRCPKKPVNNNTLLEVDVEEKLEKATSTLYEINCMLSAADPNIDIINRLLSQCSDATITDKNLLVALAEDFYKTMTNGYCLTVPQPIAKQIAEHYSGLKDDPKVDSSIPNSFKEGITFPEINDLNEIDANVLKLCCYYIFLSTHSDYLY